MVFVWVTIILVAVIIELVTPTALVSIWFALGGIIAAILAFLGVDISIQVIMFIVVTLATMLLLRPMTTKYLRGNTIATNADRLIGESAVVTKSIELEEWGEVSIKSTYWSAVSLNKKSIAKGIKVKVIAIEGAKLVVKKID